MKTENYIGIEVAKFLKENGCDLVTEYIHADRGNRYELSSFSKMDSTITTENGERSTVDYYAYHYHDIIVTHAKEFFGEWYKILTCGERLILPPPFEIVALLQQVKQKEADEYIMEHCIFSKQNK